jgi:rare lipoprotein A
MLRGWAVLGFLTSTIMAAPMSPVMAQDDVPWTESGTASFYRSSHHFFRTSSGEIYNENAMTAAHPSLPLGTVLRVTRNDDGRSIIVRINDRSAASNEDRGRVIDLSYAAAKRLGIRGIGDVTLSEITDQDSSDPEEVAEAPEDMAPPPVRHIRHHHHHAAAAPSQSSVQPPAAPHTP